MNTIGPLSKEDEAVQEVLSRINRYCSTFVEYEFGNQDEILDGTTIVEWIQYDTLTGTLSVSEDKIKEYIAGLAKKYDTCQKPREFQTSLGDWVTVEGGSYGWLLDQEREANVLEHMIRYGARRKRIPNFAQTAAGWTHSDLGDTYVEVDLTSQHVWLYVDGVQELSTDCVTGTYTMDSRRTPSGTYTIYYMQSPAVLKGADYTSPVSYWMAFNGGIGLHDANWRGNFGGDIYMYDGSHGCINLPTEAAATLYNYAYYGMPVICYYRY
ncbi:MAG: L,D-transpeptidase family protein [Lachnospiraceae bacterium]|nr:L,D-transpeptidase family protein [Lachnospiraceae bacterium]MDD3794502.1 L,D-transpeptidase family protein [Lachnospiraceae bacterium]